MSTRNQSLDVLRGIAVLMVLVYHNFLMRLDFTSPPAMLNFLARGVDLFFVLSGFLISGLLFSEYKASGTLNCWRFWIRRGFKIYPPFYALMAVALPLILWKHVPLSDFWDEVFFMQNYRPRYWPHTWSLAVEEHFYIALPILLLLLIKLQPRSRNPFRVIPIVSILLSGACFFFRLKALANGGGIEQYVFPTHLRVDALFAGVTLGYFHHFDPSFEEGRKWWMLVGGLFLCAGCAVMPYFIQLTFAYAAFAMILAWMVNQPAAPFRYFSAIAWVGRYSYSIYLWHAIAFVLMKRFFPLGEWLAPYLAVSVILGVVLAKGIEIPFLRLRDKVVPSQKRERPEIMVKSVYETA